MRTRALWALAGLMVIGLGAGCRHQQDQQLAAPPPTAVTAQQTPAPPDTACPLQVPGARLSTDQTDDGIALNFTADSENLYQVRQRVLQMAQFHNQHSMTQSSSNLVPSTARVAYTDDGARLILSPVNPADLPALQAQIQTRAQYMASTNTCAAM